MVVVIAALDLQQIIFTCRYIANYLTCYNYAIGQ